MASPLRRRCHLGTAGASSAPVSTRQARPRLPFGIGVGFPSGPRPSGDLHGPVASDVLDPGAGSSLHHRGRVARGRARARARGVGEDRPLQHRRRPRARGRAQPRSQDADAGIDACVARGLRGGTRARPPARGHPPPSHGVAGEALRPGAAGKARPASASCPVVGLVLPRPPRRPTCRGTRFSSRRCYPGTGCGRRSTRWGSSRDPWRHWIRRSFDRLERSGWFAAAAAVGVSEAVSRERLARTARLAAASLCQKAGIASIELAAVLGYRTSSVCKLMREGCDPAIARANRPRGADPPPGSECRSRGYVTTSRTTRLSETSPRSTVTRSRIRKLSEPRARDRQTRVRSGGSLGAECVELGSSAALLELLSRQGFSRVVGSPVLDDPAGGVEFGHQEILSCSSGRS